MGYLFSSWVSHFVKVLESQDGISPTNRNLLIFDGHGSHVTLKVVYKATQTRLDLLTLPLHTLCRLQPLDVSISNLLSTHLEAIAMRGHCITGDKLHRRKT